MSHEAHFTRGRALTTLVNELPASAGQFLTDSVTDIQD